MHRLPLLARLPRQSRPEGLRSTLTRDVLHASAHSDSGATQAFRSAHDPEAEALRHESATREASAARPAPQYRGSK